MFITIRNLPPNVKVKDIKSLINEKCLITDVIVGEIVKEDDGSTKKVTIGLADECDAAIVFRKLHGLLYHEKPLIIEDSRKKKGPVPGELTPMQYKATAMHMQTQQIMIPGFNAMGMMSTGLYDPMQAMIQPGVLYSQATGFAQPMMVTNQETTLVHNQTIPEEEVSQYDYQQPYYQQTNAHAAQAQPRQKLSQPRQQMSQPRQQMNQPRQQMIRPRQEMNQPRPQMNQPRQPMIRPRQQMNQPRPQMRQPRPQMNQPRPQVRQPLPQMRQLRPQMNQPRSQMNQTRPQMRQPRPQMNQPRPQMNQPRPQMNQPRPQMSQPRHQQGSKRPPYEEPRNAYENPHNPEPYKKPVVHQKVLDWDIQSREVVFKESDPVWGVRIKKRSETTSGAIQLEHTSDEMSDLPAASSKWDDPGVASESYGETSDPYDNDGYSHDDGQASYDYNEGSTHEEPYVDSYANESYENVYEDDVNQEYSEETIAPDATYDPAWESQQGCDNYDTFAANNRKRTYSQTQTNEYETSNAYEQGNMHKRNKPDAYENQYDPNEMEAEYDESADYIDESADHYVENDLEPSIVPDNTEGTQFLSFKKFKFNHKLPIAKYKAFEEFMFRNLPSRRFKTDVQAYNAMYTACRTIWTKMEEFLGINLRKYSYYLLNYIQLCIERALGVRLYNPKRWKVKTLLHAFQTTFTYPSFFLEFKKWYEFYEKLEFKETPKFRFVMSAPGPATIKIPRRKVELIPVKTKSGKIIMEGKPGSGRERAQAAYDREYAARQLIDVSSYSRPEPTTSKPVAPAVIQKKAVLYANPKEATVTVPGKPGAPVTAQSKSGAPTNTQNKPTATTIAPGKPGAPTNTQNKAGTTAIAQGKAGAPINAQNKAGKTTIAPGKPGAPTNAQNKAGAPTIAPGKAGATAIAPDKAGAPTIAPGKAGAPANAQNKAGAATIAPGKAGAPTIAPGNAGAPTNTQNKAGAATIATGKAEAPAGSKVQNLADLIKDPEGETKNYTSMDKIRTKARTLLSIPAAIANKLVKRMYENLEMDPGLKHAFEDEMKQFKFLNDLAKEPSDAINYRKFVFKKNFKRSLMYRLFNTHIARTAKITFTPAAKVPSLEACNKYFNARHGKVLLIQNNVALVLFNTLETFNDMCNEMSVAVIDGCKIQELIPLDLDVLPDEYHCEIEDAIEAEDKEQLTELVFNKEFIMFKPSFNIDKRTDSQLIYKSIGADLDEYELDDENGHRNDTTSDDVERNNDNDANRKTPKSLKRQSLEILNSKLFDDLKSKTDTFRKETKKQCVKETKDNLVPETQKKLTSIKQEQLTEIKQEKCKEDVNLDKRDKLNVILKEKLDSEMQEQIDTEMQETLDTKMQEEIDTEIKEKLETKMQEKLDTEMQEEIDTEMQEKLDTEIKETLDTEMKEKIDTEIKGKFDTKMQEKFDREMQEGNDTKILEKLDTDIHEEIDTDHDTNDKDNTEADDSRDEKIKEFLDDFEKIVNENDEVFMSEEDLEEFVL